MKFDYTENIYFTAVLCIFGIVGLLWPIINTKDINLLALSVVSGFIISTAIIFSLPRKRN